MGALDITGHVIYNPAYTYKFQLKTTLVTDNIMKGIMDDCRKQEKLFLTPTIICTYYIVLMYTKAKI